MPRGRADILNLQTVHELVEGMAGELTAIIVDQPQSFPLGPSRKALFKASARTASASPVLYLPKGAEVNIVRSQVPPPAPQGGC